jgi:hypothetical protein
VGSASLETIVTGVAVVTTVMVAVAVWPPLDAWSWNIPAPEGAVNAALEAPWGVTLAPPPSSRMDQVTGLLPVEKVSVV